MAKSRKPPPAPVLPTADPIGMPTVADKEMNNPVLEQSQLLGARAMGHAGRPLRSLGPNSEFDSRDGGQSTAPDNVLPFLRACEIVDHESLYRLAAAPFRHGVEAILSGNVEAARVHAADAVNLLNQMWPPKESA